MPTVPKQPPFFKVNKADLRYGIAEAVLLAYIAEFTRQGKTCFVSRESIAQTLQVSETRVQDMIKRLQAAGVICIQYEGRKRVIHRLSTTIVNWDKGIGIQPQRDRNPILEGIGIHSLEGSESDPYKDTNTKKYIQRNNYKEETRAEADTYYNSETRTVYRKKRP